MVISVEPLFVAWVRLYPIVVTLLLALILLLVGFLVAKVVAWAVTALLKLVKFDKLAKQVGFLLLLEKGEIKRTSSELIGDLCYWFIALMTVIAVAQSFYLPLEPALNQLFGYLVLVFLAAIILGFGLFFASLISGLVKFIAANFGIEGAKTLSRVIYYIVVIFTFLVAMAQLGIKPDVFVPQIGVIIGAVGLAAAIAFGLGCKDMAADFLHNMFKGK